MLIEFHVSGLPTAKGSPRVITRGKGGHPLPFPKVLKDSKKTEMWESTVQMAAAAAMAGRPKFEGVALVVEVIFALPRPAGHYGAGKNAGRLKPSAPVSPATKPDHDKLMRSTGDALQGIIYDDDSRIVQSSVTKIYAGRGEPTGALIRVRPAMPDEARSAEQCYSGSLKPADLFAEVFDAAGVGR